MDLLTTDLAKADVVEADVLLVAGHAIVASSTWKVRST
jgi:hypothetical protein